MLSAETLPSSSKALARIRRALSDPVLATHAAYDKPRELWDALSAAYAPKNLATVMDLQRQF